MFKFEPVGRYLSTSARTSRACCSAARSCSSTPRTRSASRPGGTTADGMFTLEDVECIAACTEAPCLQVNYRYRYRVTPRRRSTSSSTTCAPAASTTRSRRTARSPASASTSRPTGPTPAGPRPGRRRATPDAELSADGRRSSTWPGLVPHRRPKIVTVALRRTTTATRSTATSRTGGYDGAAQGAHADDARSRCTTRSRRPSLLGRGGAGFPAGTKWGFCPPGVWPRYLVVNGDESEPGTYKDRLLMERDPHQLIEGVAHRLLRGRRRAGVPLRPRRDGARPGAHRRRRSTRPTPPATSARTSSAPTSRSTSSLHWGAGAYIVGEETALIESLEGKRGMPRLKPPFFPAAKGLYMQPTIVNNVETLSNLPWIINNGGAGVRTTSARRRRPGTRMFAVSGHVNRPGVFEVENGVTTFRDADRRRRSTAAASATAASSRRSSPAARRRRGSSRSTSTCRSTSRRVDKAGSMLGSGAIVVMDETTDIVAGRAGGSCASSPASRAASARRAARARPGWSGSCSGSSTATAGPTTSTCCSTSATTSAPASPGRRARPRSARSARRRSRPIASAVRALPRRVRGLRRARPPDRRRRPPPDPRSRRPCLTTTQPTDDRRAGRRRSPITVDGRRRSTAPPGRARHRRLPSDAGVYIPRFCYHPRMKPVGMCRHVPRRGRRPARPDAAAVVHDRRSPTDMVVDTESPTVEEGPGRRARVPAHQPPARLPGVRQGRRVPAAGPGVQPTARARAGSSRRSATSRSRSRSATSCCLDRERCILCDRCTRFADEVAGDPLIHFIDRGNETAGATRSPTSRSRRTSPATPCRSARSARSPPSRTGSRPGRGTSSRSSPRARRARSAAASSCSRAATRCCATRASTPTRSTGAGCATRAASTSRRSNADDRARRAARPRRRGGLAETSWNAALDAAAAADRARRSTPAGPSGSPCSAAPGSPTRTRTPGRSSPTASSAPTNVDAQLGDGLPAELARPPAGDDRRGVPRRRRRAARRPTSRRSCRSSTSACATPPRSDAAGSSSSRPAATGLTPLRLAQRPRARPARGRRASAAPLADRRRAPSSSPPGRVVVVAGRANLGRVGRRRRSPTLRRACSTPARAPRCCRRCAAATSSARSQLGLRPPGVDDGLDGARRSSTRRAPRDASTCSSCSAPTRSPTSPTPTSPAGRSPAPAGSIAVDTFLTDVVAAAPTSCSPPRRTARSRGTTTNLEGRVTTVGQKVTPPGTARPDWMIAAELGRAARPRRARPSSSASVDAITDADRRRRSPALRRRHHGSALARAAATACSPSPAAGRAASPERTRDRRAPTAISYDYRLVVEPQALRPGRRHGACRRRWPPLAGAERGARQPARPRPPRRRRRHRGQASTAPRGTVVLAARRRRRRAAGLAAGAVQPCRAPTIADLIDATAPVTDVRVERL